jgi:hypothetical protein
MMRLDPVILAVLFWDFWQCIKARTPYNCCWLSASWCGSNPYPCCHLCVSWQHIGARQSYTLEVAILSPGVLGLLANNNLCDLVQTTLYIAWSSPVYCEKFLVLIHPPLSNAYEFRAGPKRNFFAKCLKPIRSHHQSRHATRNYFDFIAVFPVTRVIIIKTY